MFALGDGMVTASGMANSLKVDKDASVGKFTVRDLLLWTIGFAVFFAFQSTVNGPVLGHIVGLIPIVFLFSLATTSTVVSRGFWDQISFISISVSWGILLSLFGLPFAGEGHYSAVAPKGFQVIAWGFTLIVRYFQGWAVASVFGFLFGMYSSPKHRFQRFSIYATLPGVAAFIFFLYALLFPSSE